MVLDEYILYKLSTDEEYVRSCLPYLKVEYFEQKRHQICYELIEKYVNAYNKPPSKEALLLELSDKEGLNEEMYKQTKEMILGLEVERDFDHDFIIKKTEDFCKERAVHNALLEAISIVDDKQGEKGKIPEILTNALSISFDVNIGHDYIENWEARWEHYTNEEERKPFSLQLYNAITNGGIPDKTLTVAIAGTGGGKSRWMCHEAAWDLSEGRNVLYITCEMSDWRIAERIDANLLDTDINDIKHMGKDTFKRRIEGLKTVGKLVIKEYPTASASSNHFRALLKELRLKKNFRPDVIYIDYINICASARLSRSRTTSYEYVKATAEELRGLAVEFSVPVITATQTTRSGFTSSDLGLEDTAESFGLPATADFMFALINTDELKDMNQQLVKQLKNRLGDPNKNERFVIGVDGGKFKYYDLDMDQQKNILNGPGQQQTDDVPVMDNTPMGGANLKDKFRDFF